MLFSSLTFLFLFLPIVLFIYYKCTKTKRAQNMVLLISSLIFYAWGGPKHLILMLLSIAINYLFGLFISKVPTKSLKAKTLLWLMLAFNLGLLTLFKYTGFLMGTASSAFNLDIAIPSIALPLGISFFTFQGISYVIDVYRGEATALTNPLDVGLYISFFPQLVAGPIVKYETIAKELHDRTETEDDFIYGIMRFIIGLGKKVFFSNSFALIADKAFATPGLSMLLAWLGAIAYMLQIYFDFSGYSDMAIGLGRMFGFHFNENFNAPYTARSISDFWRRWHMSLFSWFKDYVYFPLGGSRVSKLKLVRNLLIVWTLTGIWHGANWTFVVWGFYFGILLVFEKLTGVDKWLEKSKLLGHAYTLLLVLIGWVFFRANNIESALTYLKAMCGLDGTVKTGSLALFYLKENWLILLLGMVACLPFIKWFKASTLIENELIQKITKIIGTVLLIGLLLLSISYLVKGVYNPFIYFNF